MARWLDVSRTYSYDPSEIDHRLQYLGATINDGNFGDLAYEDVVELAKLGQTIVDGGYLKTELIRTKSIRAEHLNVDDLAAITGTFSGDVVVGGKLLVGGAGVLSSFQYQSMGGGTFDDTGGWSNMGIAGGGDLTAGRVIVFVHVPQSFEILSADLTVLATPTFYEGEFITKWKQSRNLKLYRTPFDFAFNYYVEDSGTNFFAFSEGADITSQIWGVSTWSPTLTYSGSDPENTQNTVQQKNGDISGLLAPGATTVFYITTTDLPSQENFNSNQGLGKIVVTVTGYSR